MSELQRNAVSGMQGVSPMLSHVNRVFGCLRQVHKDKDPGGNVVGGVQDESMQGVLERADEVSGFGC